MKKKFAKFLIALVMLLLPTLASAQTYIDTSAHLTFTLSETNATITGPEAGYTTGELNIPAIVTDGTNTGTVVAIGNSAFSGRSGFTGNLTIPNSVTTIGTTAFYACSGFTGNLTIGNGVTTIGDAAFNGCSGLTGDLIIPNSVTTIGNSAFISCSGLTGNLIIGNNVTMIGNSVFNYCSGLTGNLVIPDGVTTIGDFAFSDCSGFTGNLTIPNSVTTIGSGAFYGCSGLTGDLVLPSTLTLLGYQAFANNPSLRSITFTGTMLNMSGYQMFAGCNGLEYIDIPKNTSVTGVTSLLRTPNVATAGAVFSGLPTHTIVYLPQVPTTAGTTEADRTNYVFDGICDYLNIEDSVDYFFPHEFTTIRAKYRAKTTTPTDVPSTLFTFNKGTSYSLYLPYPIADTGGIGVYSPVYYNQHNPGVATDNTFVFNKVTTLAANTPYIARVDDGSSSATLPDFIGSPTNRITVPASPVGVNHAGVPGVNTTTANTPSVEDTATLVTWTLCGTSETVDAATAASWGAWYFANNNTWYPVSGTNYDYALRQHRVFMVPSMPDAVPSKGLFGGFDNGGTNGIDNVTNDNATTTHIYNVSGQYIGEDINALPKGVYIVNGKKVIKN